MRSGFECAQTRRRRVAVRTTNPCLEGPMRTSRLRRRSISGLETCGSVTSAAPLVLAGLLLGLGGCKVGPDYAPPHAQTPSAWETSPRSAAAGTTRPAATQPLFSREASADLTAWWRTLNDP